MYAAPSFVIAGLDPAIHTAWALPRSFREHACLRRVSMDARVKPAHDE
jgi:hypothetical protein